MLTLLRAIALVLGGGLVLPLIAATGPSFVDITWMSMANLHYQIGPTGVLTDGYIIYDEDGDEIKQFDVQDGAGLMLWHRAGLRVALITARKGRLIKRRAIRALAWAAIC